MLLSKIVIIKIESKSQLEENITAFEQVVVKDRNNKN